MKDKLRERSRYKLEVVLWAWSIRKEEMNYSEIMINR